MKDNKLHFLDFIRPLKTITGNEINNITE